MKKAPKFKNIFFQLSAITILLSAILYNFDADIAKYAMVVGVSGFAAVTFTSPYPGKSIKGKRLFNFQIFSVLLMAASTYLMFIDISWWVVLLLISAILLFYSTIVLSNEYKKESKNDPSN